MRSCVEVDRAVNEIESIVASASAAEELADSAAEEPAATAMDIQGTKQEDIDELYEETWVQEQVSATICREGTWELEQVSATFCREDTWKHFGSQTRQGLEMTEPRDGLTGCLTQKHNFKEKMNPIHIMLTRMKTTYPNVMLLIQTLKMSHVKMMP